MGEESSLRDSALLQPHAILVRDVPVAGARAGVRGAPEEHTVGAVQGIQVYRRTGDVRNLLVYFTQKRSSTEISQRKARLAENRHFIYVKHEGET